MERRLLLVFALTFLVIVLFQPILKKYLPQSTTPASPAQSQNQVQSAPLQGSSRNLPEVAQVKGAIPGSGTKQAAAETETVIENDLYRITFTNRGAQVKSWILKKFNDEHGQLLELVNPATAERFGR